MMLGQQIDITTLQVAPSLHWSEGFGAWLHETGRKPLTISAYLQDMRHYFHYFGELSAVNVKAYFAMQDVDNTVKPSSRNRRLASMRVFVQWAVEAGLMDADPTVCIRREPVEPSPRDRTDDEMGRLNMTIGSGSHLKCESENHIWLGLRDRVIWILFNQAGLRISEVVGLDVTDLDFCGNEINVLGKGGKKAPVKMNSGAMNEISQWLKTRGVTSDAVISDWHGKRITRGQAWRRVKMIGAAAGVNDLKPHDLRHTFAFALSDALKKQGLPELAITNGVRKQLRHGDEKTTRLYFGVRESQIRAAMEVM